MTDQKLVRMYVITTLTFVLFHTAYTYTRVYSVVRKLARSQKKLHNHDAIGNMKLTRMKVFHQEIKTARSCFVVVVCFFLLSFLPPAIVAPFVASSSEFKALGILVWVFSLNFLNSTANSVIFFWTKTILRQH